ncbi:conserved hypothetical protein [Candida dubliniensis CD36]|uniref:VanZ-like domain-containing protein n=1 Tax=Candida dubliniensis (strain CD36 / ATCC MYA-646 / CBS 7987 / NCPF 3949 / NRRL Y-17841) TaxID=573826 RepID=B9W9F8_CANDC|nr:conserved hypothetical protein [Candida dubliniensis CD36]CAX45440.1 conserved hypothetical protein [Candida dubliniensis CD36]
MVSIRYPVLILFVFSLIGACYLGFASIHLPYDKLIHFTTFCVLTLEFFFVFDTQYKSLKVLRNITLIICTLGGSVGSEIIQNLVNPKRVFDIYDIVANILGSLLGLGLSVGYVTWSKNRARQKRINYRQLNTHIIEVPDDDDEESTDQDSTDIQERADAQSYSSEDYVNIQLKDVKH